MGCCKECMYVRKKDEFMGDYYCTYHTDPRGYYYKVSATGICNNFIKRESMADSGYSSTGGTSSSGCFLTSACVDYLGKTDNCIELETLRAFRDEYMKATENGAALVEEYYRVAPAIVEKIDASPDKDAHYAYIYRCVEECLALLAAGKQEETVAAYTAMVQNLKSTFEL